MATTSPRIVRHRPTAKMTRAPTVTDDVANTGGQGTKFQIGDTWIDTSSNTAYICCDSTSNAAVWEPITQGGVGGIRTVVNDANYTLKKTDDLVAYTALNANRTVTIDPTVLVKNKLYTVLNETQSFGKTYIKLNMASGTFDGNPAGAVNGAHGSTTFYTTDNVNVVSYGSNIVRQFFTPTSSFQCLCIGNGSVTRANVESKFPYLGQYGVFLSVDNDDSFALYDVPLSGFPDGFFTTGTMILDLNTGGGIIFCASIGDNAYKCSVDIAGRALYGFSGGHNQVAALSWDDGIISIGGKFNLGGQPTDTFSGAMSIDVSKSSHIISASHTTSATVTYTPSGPGTKGDYLEIITEADASGTVTATFASTFHPVTATQATTANTSSTICFRSDGTKWIELSRTTAVA